MSTLDEDAKYFYLKQQTYSREEILALITGPITGVASSATNPGAPAEGDQWLVNPADYGDTFTHFDNITVPVKDGDQYVAIARFVYSSGAWVLLNELLDAPIQLDTVLTNPNLFNIATIIANKAINASGDIITSSGYALTDHIDVAPETSYTLAGVSNATHGIQFQDASGAKIGSTQRSIFPFVFTTPAGCLKLQYTCKVGTESVTAPDQTLLLTGIPPQTVLQAPAGKVVKADILAAGATIDSNTIASTADITTAVDALDADLTVELIALRTAMGIPTNLFNPATVIANKAINTSTGDIATFSGYSLSAPIAVTPLTDYILDGLTAVTHGIQFQDAAGAKLSSASSAVFPYRFTTPANCYFLQYTCKTAAESPMPTQSLQIPDTSGGTFPFAGKVITLYGDSITVAFNSAFYQSQIQAKTKAATVNRRGQSSQSFAGVLQTDALIDTIITDNPDLVIIHSVNDHRTNATIGDNSNTAGAPTTIGGLKYIFNRLISYNKNVHIVLCTPNTYGAITANPASDEANSGGKYASDYAKAMIDLARVYGIPVVDLSSKVEFRPAIEGTSVRVFTQDGVHPVEKGYTKMTSAIAEVVNKIIF